MPALRRTVVIALYPGVQLLDALGPFEVLEAANTIHRTKRSPEPYEVVLASEDGAPVRSTAGFPIAVSRALAGVREPFDTLLVPGTLDLDALAEQPSLVVELRRVAALARRVVSVCTGAFLLAEAGLLDGRRVTTHWAAGDALAAKYPSLSVDPDPIYVRDGSVYTSAGVTAGMDLTLALVEQDLGRKAASTIAKWLVMYVRRASGQPQISAHLAAQSGDRDPIRDVISHIHERPAAGLSVPELAKRARMSPRNFARVFEREVGVPPGRYVARVRVETARRRLEETDDTMEQIADQSGLGSVESLRRAIHRDLGVSPNEYRARFRSRERRLDAGDELGGQRVHRR